MNILLFKYKNKPLIYYLMKMVPFGCLYEHFYAIRDDGYGEYFKEQKSREKAERDFEEFIYGNPKIAQEIKKMSEANCADVSALTMSATNKPPASTLDNWRKL